MNEPVRFWQGMSKATSLQLLDKVMVGLNASGASGYADIKQIVNLASALGGAAFKHNVTPESSPDVSGSPVFYIAEPGIYPNFGGVEVTGVAGIIGQNGEDFTVTNFEIDLAGYVADNDMTIVPAGKQLFDKSTATDGLLIGSAGNLDANPSYGVSDYIEIVSGLNYNGIASNGTGMRRLAFYDIDKVVISGDENLSFNFVAPDNAVYVRLSYYLTGKDSFMFEALPVGLPASPYEDFSGQITAISGATVKNSDKDIYSVQELASFGITKPTGIQLNILDNYAEILYQIDGKSFSQEIKPFKETNIDYSNIFDVGSTTINGLNHHVLADNAAPYRIMGTTIGANHGYIKKRLTATAHGKTNADVGSVWKDSVNEEWILINIFDENNIDFAHLLDEQEISGTTLTHFFGATNVGLITFSASVSTQFYPSTKNHSIKLLLDGNEIPNINGSYFGKYDLTVCESYHIIDKTSLLEWLKTQVGTVTKIKQFNGTSVCNVNINYVFDGNGTCTIYSDFTALENIDDFQDIMFLMSETLRDNGSTFYDRKYYVPKSLPFSFEGDAYDFTELTAIGNTPFTGRIQFTPSVCDPTGILCDRLIQFISGFTELGFAMGFLPLFDAGIAERRVNATNKALEISETKKVYMSAIDGLSVSLSKGDSFSVIGYKSYFLRSSDRTAGYFVPTKEHIYGYFDWHTIKTDIIALPKTFYGKEIEVIEKSSNVTVFTKNAIINNLVVDVDGSKSYGYLIIRAKI